MLSESVRSSFELQDGVAVFMPLHPLMNFLVFMNKCHQCHHAGFQLVSGHAVQQAATVRLNKQFGSGTGSLGLCATGIPERMGMILTLGEWENIQLLGSQLNLTNENCFFIWTVQAASFSQ